MPYHLLNRRTGREKKKKTLNGQQLQFVSDARVCRMKKEKGIKMAKKMRTKQKMSLHDE